MVNIKFILKIQRYSVPVSDYKKSSGAVIRGLSGVVCVWLRCATQAEHKVPLTDTWKEMAEGHRCATSPYLSAGYGQYGYTLLGPLKTPWPRTSGPY